MLTRTIFALALLSKPFVCNPQPVPGETGGDTDTAGSSGSTDTTDGTTAPSTTDATTMTTGAPPMCGNGEVEDGEECDDGNQAADDACTNSCKQATCGDDIVQTGVEACDDGDQDDTNACTAACQDAQCGDGIVWAGMEECDDGNQDDTDACTSACKLPVCGDGMTAGSEECDDGNQDDTDACVACKNAVCGDGKVQAGVEECDDGGLAKADGCSETCTHEYLMFVTKDSYPADMGGVAGADALCAAAAQGKLAGTYVAWISAEGDAASADIPTGKPMIRTDGMPIVATAEDLFKGGATMLLNPIDRDQEGGAVTGYAWTGTNQLGQATLLDCTGWMSSSKAVSAIGNVSGTGTDWTNDTTVEPSEPLFCDATNHVYCFRKAEP